MRSLDAITSIDEVQNLLHEYLYIADRSLATSIFLALKLGKPLFLEGEAGVGKTEIAKVLAAMLERPLIRLQCYEGLDVNTAVYEWNYTHQMLQIRLLEATGHYIDDFLPVHNLDSLEQLGHLLERLGPNRPLRRQHPIYPQSESQAIIM